jgi:hypothetical protein
MGSVFLSYARADDEPYVRKLYERLHGDGFDVWFDREHMPSRSLTFLQEIRDAIRNRERLVVVLGPAAVQSDYVRAEWQAALVEGKAVTPLLRLGDYKLVPPELKSLHCPDVRDARPSDAAIAEVLRILNEPVPPLAPLSGSIPAVPPHFQPRPDDLSQLARNILYEVEHPVVLDPPQRTTVLHGMGGVGKSVLAAALARTTSTRRVFGDGVLWVELTTTSTPLDVVRSVLTAAGQAISAGAGLSEAVSGLRQWLEQRRCLIVLDNVWAVNQIAAMVQAISPASRLLVTTRDGGIATSLGAMSQGVNALALPAALVQLADWAGVPPEELPPEAQAVAEQCGGLPFALALQGALAHDGVPWSDLLDALRDADLTFAQQQFPDYPYLDVLNVIQASVDMLRSMDASATARFLELGAFFWNEGVPTSALLSFWNSVAGVEARDGRRLLVELQRKALIRLGGTPQTAVVHDLVADYLLASSDAGKLRGTLLDHYRAQCADGWASGPDDGYFHRHLIDHLAVLNDGRKQLTDLLDSSTAEGRNAWFEASDRTGNVDAYRRQLERLINDASVTLPEVMTHVTRITSVNALAGNIPPALAAALVRSGEWTISQASGYARQCPDPKQRAACLAILLDQAKDEQRAQLIDDALAAVRTMEEFPSDLQGLPDALATDGRTNEALALARRSAHGDGKTTALAIVARHLVGAEREAIIAEAIEVCATTMDLFRAAAIEPVLPLFERDGLAKLDAAAIQQLKNPVAQGWCEISFIGRLLELNEIDAAAARARSISDVLSQAGAIAACVERLPAADREGAVNEVLAVISAVDMNAEQEKMLEAFSELPKVLLDFLPMILADQPYLLEPLKAIAPHLDGPQLTQALEFLLTTPDPIFAAQGAAALAPRLSPADAEVLISKLLPLVSAEQDEERRMSAFAGLLGAARNGRRTELLQVAFNDLRALDPSRQSAALKNLAPALKGKEIDEALTIAAGVSEASERGQCVEALISAATPEQLRRARSVIMKIGDEKESLFAASALSANLDSDTRRELLTRALDQSEYIRARVIALLAPQLDDDSFKIALDAANEIPDPGSRAEVALPALARRAPEAQRKEILESAIDIAARMTDPERRVWALEAMIDQLDAGLRDKALTRYTEEAAGLDEGWRVYGPALFLATIAPAMPEPKRTELLDEALALVPQLAESDLRRDVLSRLAAHLDLQRWTVVTELVEAEQDLYERAIMAGFLVGDAPDTLRPRFVEAALAHIEEIAAGDHGIAGSGFEGASARVLAYCADPIAGLNWVARFQDEGWRRAALREYVKATPVDGLDRVLEHVQGLSDPSKRADLKLDLAQRLPKSSHDELVTEALADALDAPADLLHDDILPRLARTLCEYPVDRLRALWRDAAPKLADRDRPQMLTVVHGLAPALVRLDLGVPTVNALSDAQRWWQ